MTGHWQLEDLELVVLWEELTHEHLPYPMVFMSRTPLYEDYVLEKRETLERARKRLNSSFSGVLEVFTHPDIKILVDGWDGRDPERADGRIRILAARKGDRGMLLVQLPGETADHSGGFIVKECDPVKLADAIIAELPTAEPGGQSDFQLPAPGERFGEVEYGYGTSPVAAEAAGVFTARSKAFVHTKPAVTGLVTVVQGTSTFGPQGIIWHRLEWRDLPDDGRYVIAHTAPWSAVPADTKRLTSMINTRIADVVRAIKDERQGIRR